MGAGVGLGISALQAGNQIGAFGANPNEAFRKSPVGQFSKQQFGPRSRAFFQTQAEQGSRSLVNVPTRGGFGGDFRGLSANQAMRINEQITLRNKTNPFSFSARQSDLQSQFFGEDIRRANINKRGLQSLLGGTSGGGSSGGSSSRSNFTSLLRSF